MLILKSLNTTVVEISYDSENEVSYIKTTHSHTRDRLRQKLNDKEREGEVVVVGDNNDEDNDIDFVRVTPFHPRKMLRRKLRCREVTYVKMNPAHPRYRMDHILRNRPVNIEFDADMLKELSYFNAKIKVGELNKIKR